MVAIFNELHQTSQVIKKKNLHVFLSEISDAVLLFPIGFTFRN